MATACLLHGGEWAVGLVGLPQVPSRPPHPLCCCAGAELPCWWWSISRDRVCSGVLGTKCLLPPGSGAQIPTAAMSWRKTWCTGRWPLTRSPCPGIFWPRPTGCPMRAQQLSQCSVHPRGFCCGLTEPDHDHLHWEHQPRPADGGRNDVFTVWTLRTGARPKSAGKPGSSLACLVSLELSRNLASPCSKAFDQDCERALNTSWPSCKGRPLLKPLLRQPGRQQKRRHWQLERRPRTLPARQPPNSSDSSSLCS